MLLDTVVGYHGEIQNLPLSKLFYMPSLSTVLEDKSQFISDIKKECGANYEKLTQSKKQWIVSYLTKLIVVDLSDNYNSHDVRDSLVSDYELITNITYEDVLELAKTIVDDLFSH